MLLVAVTVYRRFDRGVDQFDDEHDQAHADQNGPLQRRTAQPKREWRERQRQQQLLAECRLVTPGMGEALHRVDGGIEDPT